MFNNEHVILDRVERTLDNRLKPALYETVGKLKVYQSPFSGEPIEISQAKIELPKLGFEAVTLKFTWGSPWDTSWFKLTGTIPKNAENQQIYLQIDIGFKDAWPGNQCEALLLDESWNIIKAVNSRNQHTALINAQAGAEVEFYLEAAANPDMFADAPMPTLMGDKLTAPNQPLYEFKEAQFQVRNDDIWQLYHDLDVLYQLAKELPDNSTRKSVIIQSMDQSLDVLDIHDLKGSAHSARVVLRNALEAPAVHSALEVTAIGHAHIDSAWLWPVRETVRKVARTFSNVLALISEYPDFTFTATSAQQYEWLKEKYPELFSKVKEAIAGGQWTATGGMWVESDVMMPGAEALMRQFIYGTRFFEQELGAKSTTLWLPDSFGYPASLPQIAAQFGMKGFLTQKTSWNQYNKLPHSTMWWEGIDGTRIFSHFPPVNCYDSELTAEEYFRATNNYLEKGKAKAQVIPYGYGDGGGGPTASMIERARRLENLEGAPKTKLGHPDEFFAKAIAEYPNAPIYQGELYLEFHRGIYTSQRQMKSGNRRSEHLMRELELAWVLKTLFSESKTGDYPLRRVNELWKNILLNQFHDILPGSSIAWVHRVAREEYSAIIESAQEIRDTALESFENPNAQAAILNTSSHPRRAVIATGEQQLLVEVEPLSVTKLSDATVSVQHPVQVIEGDAFEIQNGIISVRIEKNGTISSLVDLKNQHQLVPAGYFLNELLAYEDAPNQFDAWDIERHYLNENNSYTVPQAQSVAIESVSELRASIKITRSFRNSTITQIISLDADSSQLDFYAHIDWHEKETLLKAGFALNIQAKESLGEIQFGHFKRSINENTSWDYAKYEFPVHRWLMVDDGQNAAAIVNDSIYGHDVRPLPAKASNVVYGANNLGVRVSLSLLRAPLFPDPYTDQGIHEMKYSLVVNADLQKATAAGYHLNLPLRLTTSSRNISFAKVDNPAVQIESVHKAYSTSDSVIVRLYESSGRGNNAQINFGFEVAEITEVSPLEIALKDLADGERWPTSLISSDSHSAKLKMHPFGIVTLKIKPKL